MKAMIPLATFNLSPQYAGMACRIAAALRANGYGCDLQSYKNFKAIFRHNYEIKGYERVWVLGDVEAAKGKIMYFTKGGIREEWDIASFIEPDEVETCKACGRISQ